MLSSTGPASRRQAGAVGREGGTQYLPHPVNLFSVRPHQEALASEMHVARESRVSTARIGMGTWGFGKAGSDHGRPEGSRARLLRPKTAEGSVEISVLVGDGRRSNRAMGGSGSSAKTDLTGEGLANVFFLFCLIILYKKMNMSTPRLDSVRTLNLYFTYFYIIIFIIFKNNN